MPSFTLKCIECGGVFAEDPALLVCPACSTHQEPGGHARGLLTVQLDELPSCWPTDLRDWRSWLPLPSDLELPDLAVGGTPLLPVPELRKRLGMPHLWVMNDSLNPSGSTKDRASWLVCAKARQYGRHTVATASTGNAATALACCTAAFGLRAVVFVPVSAPPAKLLQIRALGATLLAVDGSYDQAFDLSSAACEAHGWYNRNTALNPFTTEGKKTAALEIVAQLPEHCADTVFVGAGDGVILGGLGKGIADLTRAGLLSRKPRLIAVQAERSDALTRGWEAGSAEAARIPQADSVADSLNVEVPRNALQALQVLRDTRGCCVRVTDDEIRRAIILLGATTGIFAEPAAAAALAGLVRALQTGQVSRDERIVLLITGSGLKDPGAAGTFLPEVRRVSPHLEDLPCDL